MLDHELPFILLVVCPNVNGLHPSVSVQYILWGQGKLTVNPSYKFVMKVRKYLKDEPLVIVSVACRHCRAKGVKGITKFTDEEIIAIFDKEKEDEK